jgi:hypothetical protein
LVDSFFQVLVKQLLIPTNKMCSSFIGRVSPVIVRVQVQFSYYDWLIKKIYSMRGEWGPPGLHKISVIFLWHSLRCDWSTIRIAKVLYNVLYDVCLCSLVDDPYCLTVLYNVRAYVLWKTKLHYSRVFKRSYCIRNLLLCSRLRRIVHHVKILKCHRLYKGDVKSLGSLRKRILNLYHQVKSHCIMIGCSNTNEVQ